MGKAGTSEPLVIRLVASVTTLGLAAALVFAAVGGRGTFEGSATPTPHTANPPVMAPVTPTAAELAQWRKETATPYQRGEIVAKMQAAFSGVGHVGAGSLSSVQSQAATATPTRDQKMVVALGITGDHFWVTASYGDMARGAIWGAVSICIGYGVPAWLCSAAGYILTTWSQGWGSANNHGVWAAVYWWPPHVTGGRW